MQADKQVRAKAVGDIRAHGQLGVHVIVAREDNLEADRLQLAAQFEREREGVGFFVVRKKAADAIAGVLPAVAGIETDGRDFFQGRFLRENQRTNGFVQIELGDESAFGHGQGQAHNHAVDGGVGGILFQDQARDFVGEDEFRAVVQSIAGKAIGPRPGGQRHVAAAIDELGAGRDGGKGQGEQQQCQGEALKR